MIKERWTNSRRQNMETSKIIRNEMEGINNAWGLIFFPLLIIIKIFKKEVLRRKVVRQQQGRLNLGGLPSRKVIRIRKGSPPLWI